MMLHKQPLSTFPPTSPKTEVFLPLRYPVFCHFFHSRAVVPILFRCIPPFAHIGTFHSSPITQIQQGSWKR